MSARASQHQPAFTFINNNSREGDRLSEANRQVVRKHCRNRWASERARSRRAKPEIRIIRFGESEQKRHASGNSSPRTVSGRSTPSVTTSERQVETRRQLDVDLERMRSDLRSPSPINNSSISISNPFDTLPLPQRFSATPTLQFYLRAARKAGPFEPPHMREKVFKQRQDFWMPLAASDEAAFCALIAWIQVDFGFPEELKDRALAAHCLGTALRLTNARLSQLGGVVDDTTLFTVGMLNFAAWCLFDTDAMAAHFRGFETLLAYRSGLVIDAVGYAKSTSNIITPYKSKGYEIGFHEMKYLNVLPANLAQPFRYFVGRKEMISLVERDSITSAFLMNHIGPAPCDLRAHATLGASDERFRLHAICHATVHVCAYLMLTAPSNVDPDGERLGLNDILLLVYRLLFMREYHIFLDDIWERYPLVLMWVSLVNGAITRDPARRADFAWVLKHSIEILDLRDFDEAAVRLETFFTWPGCIATRVRGFWREALAIDTDNQPISSGGGSSGSSPRSPGSRHIRQSDTSVCKGCGNIPEVPSAERWQTRRNPQPTELPVSMLGHGCLFTFMKRDVGPSEQVETLVA